MYLTSLVQNGEGGDLAIFQPVLADFTCCCFWWPQPNFKVQERTSVEELKCQFSSFQKGYYESRGKMASIENTNEIMSRKDKQSERKSSFIATTTNQIDVLYTLNRNATNISENYSKFEFDQL